MVEFEKNIHYTFNDKELLRTALTHSSYANEKKGKIRFNERLEFLGDAVLQLITSEKLFKENPNMPEGKMSKQRAALVCEDALAGYAHEINLGDYLNLGKGEETTGGRKRPSILSDAFEAVIGAIFLDGGMEPAKKFVLHFVDAAHLSLQDYKTLLQEIIQQNPGEKLSYVVTDESGPDHDKQFTMEVHLNSNVIGKGTGKSKKHAEQAAAKEALALMGYKDNI
ncbi:MAG: ribonuclease III [Oscillospiraceae bacterium]|nr:ribonuclease III [Oscillospiraceae bacterium]MDY4585461.1 ribonuclease III [Oscillospiraceae bacterium]